MVIKKHILKTLKKLEGEYNECLNSTDVNDPVFRCKLATIEYCGWIEETFDLIAKRAVKGRLKTQPYRKMAEDCIKRTYGFQYEQHLRLMLLRIIGLVQMEAIEIELSKCNSFSQFTSELKVMKEHRNSAAHTWVQNTTPQYPSPSQIIGSLNIVYPVSKKLYSEICRLR